MQDAWRAYLEMALGLTEAPRKKAQQVVGDLVNRGGATAGQLQGLAEDLISTGLANREALSNIVRFEVDRALGAVGLATAEEVGELTSRMRELEGQLRQAQARLTVAEVAADSAGIGAAPSAARLDAPVPAPTRTTRTVAKKAVAKKAVAKKAVAKKAATKASGARRGGAAGTKAVRP